MESNEHVFKQTREDSGSMFQPADSTPRPDVNIALPEGQQTKGKGLAEAVRVQRRSAISAVLAIFGALFAAFNWMVATNGLPLAWRLVYVGIAIALLGVLSRWAIRTCTFLALLLFLLSLGIAFVVDPRNRACRTDLQRDLVLCFARQCSHCNCH